MHNLCFDFILLFSTAGFQTNLHISEILPFKELSQWKSPKKELSIDQLVVTGQQGLFCSFNGACQFCHLEKSCTASFLSWERALNMAELCQYFTFLLACCCWRHAQAMEALGRVTSWPLLHHKTRQYVTWQDTHVLSYCTYLKHTGWKEGPEQSISPLLYCCCLQISSWHGTAGENIFMSRTMHYHGEMQQVNTEMEDVQHQYWWCPAPVNLSLYNLRFAEENQEIK